MKLMKVSKIFCWLLAVWLVFACVSGAQGAAATAANMLTDTQKKGVIVMVDCPKAMVEEVFAYGSNTYKIYARFSNKTEYDALMASATAGVQAAMTVRLFPEYIPTAMATLPFPDHFANVVIVNNTTVPDAECERVVSPGFKYYKTAGGNITAGYPKTKSMPGGMASNNWTSYDMSFNLYKEDSIGFPFLSKWAQEPMQYPREEIAVDKGVYFCKEFMKNQTTGNWQTRYGLVARSAFNGELLWSNSGFSGKYIGPVSTGYVGRNNDTLTCYDHYTGATAWTATVSLTTYPIVLGVSGDILFFYNKTTKALLAFDSNTRTTLWTKTLDPYYAPHFENKLGYAAANNRFYALLSNGTLAAYNATTGVQIGTAVPYTQPTSLSYLQLLAGGDFVYYYNDQSKVSTKYQMVGDQLTKVWDSSIGWITAVYPDGKIGAYDTLYAADGQTQLATTNSYGCGGTFFNSGYIFGQYGPEFDVANSKETPNFANKAACNSGDGDGGLLGNNNIFQSSSYCRCHINWTLYGLQSNGKGDTGFSYNRVPPTGERLFVETNGTTISTPLATDGLDWTTFRKDNVHSASSKVMLKHSLDGTVTYTPATAEKVAPGVTAGNYYFYGTEFGKVRCLDMTTGAVVWQYQAGGEIKVSPTVYDHRLYVGSEDGFLYCFEAATGRLLWRFMGGPQNRKVNIWGKIKSTWPINSTVLIDNGVAYVAAGRQYYDGTFVYALNPTTGAVIWEKNIGVTDTPADSEAHQYGNATILTMGKGYLWVGGFRWCYAAGIKLSDQSVVRFNYMKAGNNLQSRGVYTAFFRDYLYFGGTYMYDIPYELEALTADIPKPVNGGEQLAFLKIQPDGAMTPMANSEFRVQEPQANSLQSGAWDDDVYFTGKELFDADKFEAKLNRMYEPGFVVDNNYTVFQERVQWLEWDSLMKYSAFNYTMSDPTIAKNALLGYSLNDKTFRVYTKDAAHSKSVSVALDQPPIPDSIVVNRNGIVAVPTAQGKIYFFDIGNPPAQYALTVNNGAGSGTFTEGLPTAIVADAAPGGQVFNQWTGDADVVAAIADKYSSSTTVAMPSKNAAVTALFSYARNLTVNGGSGSCSMLPFRPVTISAAAAPAGQMFDKWTGDPAVIAQLEAADAATTTLYMPDQDATLTATYKNLPTFPLVVDSGSGDGTYYGGQTVSLSAAAAPGGYIFYRWLADASGGAFAQKYKPVTTYTMPQIATTLQPEYITWAGTFLLNFGPTPVGAESHVTWNNITAVSGAGSSVTGMKTIANSGSLINVALSGAWQDVAELGEDSDALYPATAQKGTLVTTMSDSAGMITISGLNDAYYYNFEIFSSLDSFATNPVQITVQGVTKTVQAQGNVSDKLLFSDITPVSGSITIEVKRSGGALYGAINAIKMVEKTSRTLYALTVNNGSGDGSYVEGAIPAVTANTAPAGKRFAGWIGDIQYLDDPESAETFVTMPAGAVTVQATYEFIPDIGTVRVDFGSTASLGNWNNIAGTQAGQTITPLVDTSGSSKQIGFRLGTGWAVMVAPSEVVSVLSYPSSAYADAVQTMNGDPDRTILFTGLNDARQYRIKIYSSYHLYNPGNVVFSSGPAVATVNTYQNTNTLATLDNLIPVNGQIQIHADISTPNPAGRIIMNLLELEEISVAGTQPLIVTGGAGDGDYAEGATVTIVADAPPGGQVFFEWAGDVQELADRYSANTTLVMPGHSVNLTAVFGTPAPYYLGVVNGTGAGTYSERAEVPIAADAAPTGMVFERWTGDVGNVADIYAASTVIVMPSHHATVTASYKSRYADYDFVVTSSLDSGDGSLRDAIAMASAGQVVGFAASVTALTLNSEIAIDKNIVIDGENRVSISGGWSGGAATNGTRAFSVAEGASLELRRLTVRNCYKESFNGNEYGGAILNNGTLILKQCTVKDSKVFANMAGAVSTDKYACGAGVASTGTAVALAIEDCTFSGNIATGMADGDTTGDPDESYGQGGAVYANAGTLTITRSLFANNSALDPSAVGGNVVGGGGVYLALAGTTTLSNCTFTGNTSARSGGALQTVAGTVKLYSCTVYANTPGSANGMLETKDPGVLAVYSSIVIGSTAGKDLVTDTEAAPMLLDHCLISSTASKLAESTAAFADATTAFSKVACQQTAEEPKLGSLASNGGPTQTISLQAGSPAIGNGSNPLNLESDQRGPGYPRVDHAGTVDIGAYEVQSTWADIAVSRFGSIASGGTDAVGTITSAGSTRLNYTVSSCGTQALTLTLPVSISSAVNCSAAVATAPDASVNAGSTTPFAIDVTPSGIGAWSFVLSVANNVSGKTPYTLTVSGSAQANVSEVRLLGNGTEIAGGDLSPAVVDGTDFGTVGVGGWQERVFVIHNAGLADLTLTGTPKVSISGSSDFVITEQPSLSVIPASSGVVFKVAYWPSAAGADDAVITVANSDSNEGAYTFAIGGVCAAQPEVAISGNGTAIASGDDTPASSDFTDFGATTSRTFTITNSGDGTLNLTGTPKVAIVGSGAFTVTSQPSASVASGGGTTTFTITYNTASADPAQALVRIATDDADEGLYSFNIKANGYMPGVDNTADDMTAPGIAVCTNADNSKILVFFNEPVDLASAQTAGNYAVSGGVTVSSATVDPRNPYLVALTTSGFTSSKTVTVNNVKDCANNPIASNSTVTMRYTPSGGQVMFENMDSNPGWTGEGLWAWGQPTGVWTDHILYYRYDPSSGYNGTNAYCYGLSANYENSMMRKYLTTPTISTSLQGLSNLRFKFQRWFGAEWADGGGVDFGTGVSWTTLWSNQNVSVDFPQQNIFDNSWTAVNYDLTDTIGLNAQNAIRWWMGNSDGQSVFGGWNIDEVELGGKYDDTNLPPRIEVQEGQQVTVNEGGSATIHVRLASAPSGTVTVEAEKLSGSADFTTSGIPSFTSADYNTWKPITITKSPDSNSERNRAMFRLVSRGKVTGFGVVNGGQNYVTGGVGSIEFLNSGWTGERHDGLPMITFTGGGGTGATAVVEEDGPGPLHSANVIAPGSGYTSLPTITVTSTKGSGCSFTAKASDMAVRLNTITLGAQGSGYTSEPTVWISPTGGTATSAAVVRATVSGGKVTALTIAYPGCYSFATTGFTISISGGGGTGATATATATKGFNMYNAWVFPTTAGKDYTYGDTTITVSGGGGSGAILTPKIYGQGIKKVAITNSGSGYTTAPTVVINPCTTPAVLTPVLNAAGTSVVGATITDPGSGYTHPPDVYYSDGATKGNMFAFCEITGGQVTKVNVISPATYGAGKQLYTWPGHPIYNPYSATAKLGNPVVTITGGDGADSTGTATTSNGVITGVSTASTVGYKYAPKVTVTGGTGAEVYARIEGGAQYCFDVIELESGANLPPTPTITSPSETLSNVLLTDKLYLMGDATDSTAIPAGSFSYAWSKVSGPGTVTFENASAKNTSVTFSANGEYILRLTVSDGQYSSSVDRRVMVTDVPLTGTLRGIAGHYPLDEASGATVATNLVNSAKNGWYEGSPVLSDAGGKFGGCVTTTGTNAVILGNASAYDVAPTSQYTVSFWFKASAEATKYIFGKGSKNGTKELVIYTASGSIKVVVGGSTRVGTVSYGDNAWHHLAIVNSGTNMTLYVDGNALITDNPGAELSPGMDFVLGAYRTDPNNTGLSSGFAGGLDDARIYNVALTSTEVALLAGTVDLETPPIITQNSPTMANINETVLFSVVCRNPAGAVVSPASHSWEVVSGPVGGTYTFTDPEAATQSATFHKKGTYRIRYTAATAKFASVSEFDIQIGIPVVTQQPADVAIVSGATATLSVGAYGSTLSYQWYEGASGATGTPVFGATSASFTTPALTTTKTYWCRVTNSSSGGTADSDAATVSILVPPVVDTQPQASQTGDSGSAVSLSVGTSTPGVSYQWYEGVSGDTTNPVSGATSATFSPTVAGPTRFWCRITNAAGTTDSATAEVYARFTLNAVADAFIRGASSTNTYNYGATTSMTVKYSASYDNSNDQKGLLKWDVSSLNPAWEVVSGAFAMTVKTVTTAGGPYSFRAAVPAWTEGTGNATASGDGVTYLKTDATNNWPAANWGTSCMGATALGTDSNITATGAWTSDLSSAGVSLVQSWISNSVNNKGVFLVATGTATIIFHSRENGTPSQIPQLKVACKLASGPSITSEPSGVTITSGNAHSMSVTATGATAYQWYEGARGDTSVPISGATTANYTTPALTASKTYWVKVTGSGGTYVYSQAATVTVAVNAPEMDVTRGGAIPDGGSDTVTGTVAQSPTSLTYTIANSGAANLSVTTPATVSSLSNCSISVTTQPANTVAALGSTTVVVSVTPTAAGAWTAGVSIASDDANENPYNWTIGGVADPAPAPEAGVSRSSIPISDEGADGVSGSVVALGTQLTYVIANSGNAGMTLGTATVSGATNCSVAINTQPDASVGIGATSNFVVTVTPASAGAWSFNASVPTNDGDENPYNWAVSGVAITGTTPEIGVSRGGAVTDGGSDTVTGTTVSAGTQLTYTVANSGTASLAVSNAVVSGESNCSVAINTQPSATVAAGGNTSLVLTVTPAAEGAWSYSISVANDDSNENPYNWTVSGTAGPVPTPEIAVTRGGAVADGGTDSVSGTTAQAGTQLTYTIANSGNANLSMSDAVVSGQSNCSVTVDTQPSASVAGSGNTSLVLTVTPSAEGAWSFAVSVANNDADENPYNWTASGTASPAPAPEMAVTRSGAVADGGTDSVSGTAATQGSQLTYTIANSGNASLSVSNAVVSGQSNCSVTVDTQPSASVAGSGNTSLVLTVTPSAEGAWSFAVSMANNDGDENPYNWTVGGTAGPVPAPEIVVTRGGAVADGGTDSVSGTAAAQASQLTYTVANSGNANLSVSNAVVSGQSNCSVTVDTQPSASVAGSGNTSLVLTVTPSAEGAWSFAVSVANNDADENPYNWTVSGTASQAFDYLVTNTQENSITPPDGSLRKAILDAVAAGGTKTIGFQSGLSGTITITTATPLTVAPAAGKNLNLTIVGNGSITLSGGTSRKILLVSTGSDPVGLTVKNLIFRDGLGGGIESSGASKLTFVAEGCSFIGNKVTSTGGGAINLTGHQDSLFTDCVFDGNQANYTNTGTIYAGALYVRGANDVAKPSTVTIDRCLFKANALSSTGTPTVARDASGGAFAYIRAGASDNATVVIKNSTFSGNSVSAANATLHNPSGGAVFTLFSSSSTLKFYNCTLAGNSATNTGAASLGKGGAIGAITAGSVSLYNTIVSGNTASDGLTQNINLITATLAGYNSLIHWATGSDGSGITDGTNGCKVGTGYDPLLSALADNGGLTQTRAIAAGSSAKDAASATYISGGAHPTLATDQRGAGYARNSGLGPDMGAYEYQEVPAPEIAVTRSGAVADGGSDSVSGSVAGSGTQLSYTVANGGTAGLTLSEASVADMVNCSVAVDTQPAGTVAAGQNTALVLTVTPAAGGVWSFAVSVPNNDGDENPYNWTASGTAVALSPEMAVTRVGAVSDGGSDSVEGTTAGSAMQLTYTVANTGDGALSLTGPAVVGSQTNCSVVVNTQPSASVAAGGNSSLVLTVTPAAAGAWSFTVSVPNDDGDENPYNWTAGGTAQAAGLSFEAWATGKGLSGGGAGLLADPDGDGMSNLLEFALNANPGASDGSKLPAVAVEGGNLVLRYRKGKGLLGLGYTVQSSTDLGAVWTDEGEGSKETDADAETEVWKVSKPAGTKLFLRLKISKP